MTVEARDKDENSQEIRVKSEGKEAEVFTLVDMDMFVMNRCIAVRKGKVW